LLSCRIKYLVLFTWLILVPVISEAQNKDELEKRRVSLLNEIKESNILLTKTKKTKRKSLNQLLIIRRQIRIREKLISDYERQIFLIDNEIRDNKEVLGVLNNDLIKLKKDYEKMLRFAYRNRKAYDRLMFVFASADFNQAYRRLKYFQQYSAFRKKQVKLIEALEYIIDVKNGELNDDLAELDNLIKDKEKESYNLNRQLDTKNNVVLSLRREERKLKRKIKDKKRLAKSIEDAIRKIIAEEAKKMAKSKGGEWVLTPEQKLVSDNFGKNKGYLPWPTERGLIVQEFGEHWHPVIKGIKIKNNGVDISTTENADARCVFDGEVTKVFNLPMANKAVIIRHGKYLSVYANLSEVYVREGDKVVVKQRIGKIYTDKEENKTNLHLEIREQFKLLNPEKWLAKNS